MNQPSNIWILEDHKVFGKQIARLIRGEKDLECGNSFVGRFSIGSFNELNCDSPPSATQIVDKPHLMLCGVCFFVYGDIVTL